MRLMCCIYAAEYSRTFMRIACHYFEGKTIHPVTPGEIKEDSSSLRATDSDASSSAGTESDGMQAEDPQKVPSHWTDFCRWLAGIMQKVAVKPHFLIVLNLKQAALVGTQTDRNSHWLTGG